MQEIWGGIIIGISSVRLTEEEKLWLNHPLVVGVILFKRNFESISQLKALCQEIKAISPNCIISVDHEGGRVQRFRDGFTVIPPMQSLGCKYDHSPCEALHDAYELGLIMTSELKSVGIDFSYAPVCDLDYQNNSVIGDRAFHHNPNVVAELVSAFYKGMKAAKGIGVAKHFPGHGYVAHDTHLEQSVDDRSLSELELKDLIPFKQLINDGIEAIMPSHIVYPCVDPIYSAVTSEKWHAYLREKLGFKGLIISDDLDMQGANFADNILKQAQFCFSSGIDIILCCNDFDRLRTLLGATKLNAIDSHILTRYYSAFGKKLPKSN